MAKYSLSLRDMVRSASVTRWHCVPTRSVQSLAELKKEICSQYHYYHEKVKEKHLICLVKLADIMDAICYLDQNGYTR